MTSSRSVCRTTTPSERPLRLAACRLLWSHWLHHVGARRPQCLTAAACALPPRLERSCKPSWWGEPDIQDGRCMSLVGVERVRRVFPNKCKYECIAGECRCAVQRARGGGERGGHGHVGGRAAGAPVAVCAAACTPTPRTPAAAHAPLPPCCSPVLLGEVAGGEGARQAVGLLQEAVVSWGQGCCMVLYVRRRPLGAPADLPPMC